MKSRLSLFLVACCAGSAALADHTLETVVVTGSREAEAKSETPATVNVISEQTINSQRPTHPKGVLNQVPGVWVSNLSGEGHSTSIRQPLTTAPMYLYLEDGVPTRSTGFFNHNALYEINVPQSGGIEVSKGPGSALYGSDAIGGSVNVLTRTPPQKAEAELTTEAGSSGWGRVLASGGDRSGNDAWRANLNLTRADGWQDHAEYDRESASARWDHAMGDDTLLKTVLAWSHIDQNHVGDLTEAEYRSDPQKNNAPISYRKVDALRLSSAYEKESGNTLLSFTPYFRHDQMTIVPNWSLSYDPTIYTTENHSLGLLSKYRIDFAPLRSRLITGLDLDYSPGSQQEDKIKTASSGNIKYASFVIGNRIYDYDVTFSSVSPYVQTEFSPTENWRVTAGLRYDSMRYDYNNHLANMAISSTLAGFPASGWYGHVADTDTDYEHWSPKLGATYAFTEKTNGFVSLTEGFRTPSQGQVFRPSRAGNAVSAQIAADGSYNLKPVVVDNIETGLRGKLSAWDYEVSLYHMIKKDDILSYRDPVTLQTYNVNAGETLHRGIEIALGADISEAWRFDTSISYARHTYEEWKTVVSGVPTNYSGNEMEAAPRVLTNTRLTYTPVFMNGGRIQTEWVRVGQYEEDAANTHTYDGHDLVNLRVSYPFHAGGVSDSMEVYANVDNLFDKQYAETTSYSTTTGNMYTAGLPRMFYVGVQAKW
jgi:outer membrane receptor protein involved in Fe transport